MSRHAHGLLPDPALARMPAPVKEAQVAAVEAAEAQVRGEGRAAEARLKADAAPAADAERLAEAARAGTKAPAGKAPELAREAEAAEHAVQVLRGDRKRAVAGIAEAIAENLPACMTAQNEAVGAIRERAAGPLAELAEIIGELEREHAVLTAISSADAKGSGRLNFTRINRLDLDAPSLVSELRDAVDHLGAQVSETAGRRQQVADEKAAEQAAHHRQMRAMASGIYVGP